METEEPPTPSPTCSTVSPAIELAVSWMLDESSSGPIVVGSWSALGKSFIDGVGAAGDNRITDNFVDMKPAGSALSQRILDCVPSHEIDYQKDKPRSQKKEAHHKGHNSK